jgi:hypothetical protein
MMPSKPQQVIGIIPASPFTTRPNSLRTEVFIRFQKHKATTNLAEHALAIHATPIFLYMLLGTVNLPLNKPVTLYIILYFICCHEASSLTQENYLLKKLNKEMLDR